MLYIWNLTLLGSEYLFTEILVQKYQRMKNIWLFEFRVEFRHFVSVDYFFQLIFVACENIFVLLCRALSLFFWGSHPHKKAGLLVYYRFCMFSDCVASINAKDIRKMLLKLTHIAKSKPTYNKLESHILNSWCLCSAYHNLIHGQVSASFFW